MSRGNFRHGDARMGNQKRLYKTWCNMLSRCNNPNTGSFVNYGARGITVCEAWSTDYCAFRDWALANGYTDTLSIERKNNARGYEPDNCEWIPKSEQARHRRCVLAYSAFGESKSMVAWSEDSRCKHSFALIKARINRGWDIEAAMTAGKAKRSRGTIRMITVGGKTQSVRGWAKELGLKAGSIHQRIYRGDSPEEFIRTHGAIVTP